MIVSPSRLVAAVIASVLVVVPVRWIFFVPVAIAIILAVATLVDWWRYR